MKTTRTIPAAIIIWTLLYGALLHAADITNLMMGFKSFESAQRTLAGIELVRMIKKDQMVSGDDMSPAQQFYALAA